MSILERLHAKRCESREKEIEQRACDIYQVQEYNGELWLTFNGNLFCPASMMKNDAVDSVGELRKMFIERNAR